MEFLWERLVDLDDEFGTLCDEHVLPKRFYDVRAHQACCEECFRPSNVVQVYRNMLRNVVRVAHADLAAIRSAGVQVYISNRHTVVYLRPQKKHLNDVYNASPRACACGRGVGEGSRFCSVACLLTDHKPKIACIPSYRVKKPQMFRKTFCIHRRRKPSRVARSPTA